MDIHAYCARTTANIGDKSCDPTKYFDLGANVKRFDIRDPDVEPGNNIAICGGGGMLVNSLRPCVFNISNKYKNGTILWGIGLNNNLGGKADAWPRWLPNDLKVVDTTVGKVVRKRRPALIGSRDFTPAMRHLWVPCASCMHPEFDVAPYPAQLHDVVVYDHYDHPVPVDTDAIKEYLRIDEVPRRKNACESIGTVLDFLRSGRVIFTTSYHGALWGVLLGRVVIAFAWSSKFLHMRVPPAMLVPIDSGDSWESYYDQIREQTSPKNIAQLMLKGNDLLFRSRQANMWFAEHVRQYIRSKERDA